ncbi:helix-turn-helix domain-containing protein [Ruminococcaceae bacterium OttesenSCG-928-A11]|nr:helix-turn-helix domain-containing protein [Ruminococcaceae bacterium OttesenSCG-928-A11]
MAVFRVEKTRDYTVMANHHLRNTALSLKAKGLLSLMLSLPEDWDYTTKGLARICKDGVDSICSTVKELEEEGYVIRRRIRNDKGQMTTVEYIIREQPEPPLPEPEKPKRENPVLDNPILDDPVLENPTQLNTKKSSNQKSKTDLSNTQTSNPIQSNPYEPPADRMGKDTRETYREIILENIEYDIITQDKRLDRERLDEIVELLVDTVCSARQTIRVAGDDFPAEVVKSRLLKLDSGHIQYVLDCMAQNTTYIRNIKKYLLAALFNAPVTMDSYYSALVNHDMYGSGERR